MCFKIIHVFIYLSDYVQLSNYVSLSIYLSLRDKELASSLAPTLQFKFYIIKNMNQ